VTVLQPAVTAPIETNGLRPLEIASSIVLGIDPEPPSGRLESERPPVAAIERSLLRALQRPPCLVSFSGGRDSSALLAVAVRVARREGLPDPIAVTGRFPHALDSQEAEWQEQVVRHLGLTEWVQRDFGDELDLIGPVARALIERDGLPYPSNLHLMFPLMEEGRGGTFVTGLGGDQTLASGGRALDVLARRTRPVPRDVLRVAFAVAPRAVRRPVLRRRGTLSFPWLRPEANAMLGRAWLEDELSHPLSWNARLRFSANARYMGLTLQRVAQIGAIADIDCIHPFAEPQFVDALARQGGMTGFGSRTAAMRALFADALPPQLVGRSTKASFNEVLWSRYTRGFVTGLDQDELDEALSRLGLSGLVDPASLAGHWSGPAPLANSFLLLQACWLALTDP
jgi:hypothetical protein